MTNTRLFLSSVPNLTHLVAFEAQALECCTVPATKAKCRELVRGDPLLLASPINQQSLVLQQRKNNYNMWVIAKKEYVTKENTVVQQKLAQGKIKVIRQIPVSMNMVSTCYYFTLTARLAPKWNVIGDWIVKGCDIFKTGRAQALKLKVNITAKEIMVAVSALKMTMNFLKPDDLNISTVLLNQFKKDPQLIVNESAITTNRCFVLPNFTQAHVFSAAHSIPSSSTFNSFDKIRLHWKRQYGYILPESQNLFYEVFFKFNPGTFFSYPGCCVTTSHPIVCPSKDTDQLATSFINDIHSRLPSLCGQQIKYSKKPVISSTSFVPVQLIGTRPTTKPLSNKASIKNSVTLGKPNLQPLGRNHLSQVVPNTDINNYKEEAAVPGICNSYSKQLKKTPTSYKRTNGNPTTTMVTAPLADCTNSNSSIGGTKRPRVHDPDGSVQKRFCGNRSLTSDMTRVVPGSGMIRTVPSSPSAASSMNKEKRHSLSMISDDIMKLVQKSKVSSLKEWLKREGVSYTNKEKKEELIGKVIHHLQESGQKEFKI